jgi:hypothetical protein
MFTPAPRNMALAAHVVVLHSGNVVQANTDMADILKNYELLEAQGKLIVGKKLWTNTISPLL